MAPGIGSFNMVLNCSRIWIPAFAGMTGSDQLYFVIPAKAGIQFYHWDYH